MLGHKIGMPAIDRWIVSRLMHLGDAFTDMVERHRDLDIPAIAAASCPTSSTTRSGAGWATSWSGESPVDPIGGKRDFLDVSGASSPCDSSP